MAEEQSMEEQIKTAIIALKERKEKGLKSAGDLRKREVDFDTFNAKDNVLILKYVKK